MYENKRKKSSIKKLNWDFEREGGREEERGRERDRGEGEGGRQGWKEGEREGRKSHKNTHIVMDWMLYLLLVIRTAIPGFILCRTSRGQSCSTH